jgi:uncharacterized protein YbaP (TraB family)
MYRKILGAVAALALGACATAAPRAEAAPEPALWAVRDADSTIYLYGTIHMRKAGAPWGGPAAARALDEADEVWTEVEIDRAREAEVQAIVVQYGIDTSRTLSSRLSPERAAQLKSVAGQIGLPLAQVETMKPWLASLTFSIVPMMQAGYDPEHGVDRSIDRAARAAGKRMRWFETGEEQIRFLSGFDEPLQIAMLEEALDEVNEGPAVLAEMEAAWERGDVDMLTRRLVDEMKRDYPELYDVLLTRRNAAWVETLMKELEGSGVDFVAVGAAHLAGPDSVPVMLRKRGLRVERVR